MKPRQIKIHVPATLDEVIEGVIILDDIIEKNRRRYRDAWPTWLPSENEAIEDGLDRMAYIPVVCMRKTLPQHREFRGKVRDIPYFILVLNQARETRPKSEKKKQEKGDKSHCKLCKNILERGMVISKIDDYFLTPNGYPYHMYASLLIHQDIEREQGEARVEDIATWMKTSILLDQYVFYNTIGAGASIKEHQHAQVVDPKVMRMDNETVPYPILNPALVSRESVNDREDVFRLQGYPVDALIFTGRDAPYKTAYAAHLLASEGHAYNILVNKNEIFVIGRNREKERSICIRRKVGGYEITGVALLGDVEEKSGGLDIKVKGAKIFSEMDYDTLAKNLIAASIRLDNIARHF